MNANYISKTENSRQLIAVFEGKKEVAGVTGLEPAASGVTGQRSNQLSYTPAIFAVCWNINTTSVWNRRKHPYCQGYFTRKMMCYSRWLIWPNKTSASLLCEIFRIIDNSGKNFIMIYPQHVSSYAIMTKSRPRLRKCFGAEFALITLIITSEMSRWRYHALHAPYH